MNLAAPHLRRFCGHVEGFESFAGSGIKKLAEFLVDRSGIHIPHHDESQIVRDIAGFIIVQDILAGELVVDIEVTDYWMPERACCENRVEHELGALATGIIKSHGELAADDFLLFRVFLLRKRGILHRIGEDRDGIRGALFWHIDPVDRAIKGSVGIDITAAVLDLLGDLAWRALFRAFEKHVLKDVRQPGAHFFTLVYATRAAPSLNAGYRCAAVLLDDEREAVFIREDLGLGFGECQAFRCFGLGVIGHKKKGNCHGSGEKTGFHRKVPTLSGGSPFKESASGRKGATKASRKSNTSRKLSAVSSSVFPKMPAWTRLKTI